MAKMTKTQQVKILEAHARRAPLHIASNCRAALNRSGWASGYQVTRAGLIAAGVDVDAIHAEALIENA